MTYHRPYLDQVDSIFDIAVELVPQESYPLPSEWAESKRVLGREYTDKPGPFRFDNAPFMREILDCLSPQAPIREIALMKGVQVGATQGILENFIGYTIAVYPVPVLYSSATQELTNLNMSTRVDAMIQTCGLQGKIRPTVVKKSNKSTGDTVKKKEFAGGVLYGFGAKSASNARQFSAAAGLFDEVDDWDDEVGGQGCPVALLKARTNAFSKTRKLLYLSTPTNEGASKITAQFARGDKRYYNVPCPHCNEMQVLVWGADDPEGAGVKFKKDGRGAVIRDSVHYQCVNGCEISEFQKYEMLKKGVWIPTAQPIETGVRSYHISSFYSNFFDWYQCCCDWVEAGSNKKKLKAFVNNILGETWKEDVKTIDDDSMQKNNTRPYRPGTVPNELAERDGNGKIVCLIATVDVNGMHQNPDGWLAIEIKGHCRGGQTYDIAKTQLHGNTDVGGNAWQALREILDRPYLDESGMEYRMLASGIDSSPKTKATYAFCSQASNYIAVKGKSKVAANDRIVMRAKNAQGEMWSIDTVYYKNNIAAATQAGWSSMTGVAQPPDFMNFPNDKFFDGLKNTEFEEKYKVNMIGDGFNDLFFKNFSAEKPIIHREDPEDEIGVVVGWEKTNTRRFNHFFDTTVYNLAMLDIACKVLAESNPDTKNDDTRKIVGFMADFLEEDGRPFY